ncbi:MAG: molecular chaperone DnaJ, partial [Planctomycetota bacterium]
DADKRARYDRFGHAGVQGAAGRGGGGGFSDMEDIFDAFGDIFGGAFGGGGRRSRGGGRRVRRGSDIRTSVTIDLIEAARGVKKPIDVRRTQECEHCGGTGAKPGSKPETCSTCAGHGQVIQGNGFLRVQVPCATCRGTGVFIRDRCPICGGDGRQPERVTLDVSIPAGIDNGMTLCLRGEGEAGEGGRGDLYVDVRVKDHPLFEREGPHLTCQVPISYTQAALGASVEIPTIGGSEALKIPAGTQPDKVFRIRGEGMPDPHGGPGGDLYVHLALEVPRKLDETQDRLLRELAEHEKTNVSPHQKGWLDTVYEFFAGRDAEEDDAK